MNAAERVERWAQAIAVQLCMSGLLAGPLGCTACPSVGQEWTIEELRAFIRLGVIRSVSIEVEAHSEEEWGGSYFESIVSNADPAEDTTQGEIVRQVLRLCLEDSKPAFPGSRWAIPGNPNAYGTILLRTPSVTLCVDMMQEGFRIGNSPYTQSVFVNDRLRALVLQLLMDNPAPPGWVYMIPVKEREANYWGSKKAKGTSP